MSEFSESRKSILQKRSKALRYLLLRYLWKNRESVVRETYLEITHSLVVSRDEDGKFVVSWNHNGKSFKSKIPEYELSFYQKGVGLRSSEKLIRDEIKNKKIAQNFVLEALGIQSNQESEETYDSIYFEPYYWVAFILNWIGCFVILWALGVIHWPAVLLLGSIMSLEFLAWRGKCLSALLFIVFPFLGFYWVAFIGGCIYGLLQFFDPNPYYRILRTLAPLIGGLIGFLFILSSVGNINFGLWEIVLFLFCIFIAFYRTMLLSHFRFMPLVFPLFGPAFYLDGCSAAGWCIAGLSFIELIVILKKRKLPCLFKYGQAI